MDRERPSRPRWTSELPLFPWLMSSRLKLVENQMTSMQSALHELIQMQRASLSGDMSLMPPPPGRLELSEASFVIDGMTVDPEPFSTRPLPGRLSTAHHSPRILPQYPSTSYASDEDEIAKVVLSSRAISPWNSMASLAEAARLKHPNPIFQSDRSASPPSTSRKRKASRRQSFDELHELSKRHSLTRHENLQQPPDCIDVGICDEPTAKGMYDLWVKLWGSADVRFMENCLVYMPCFDPEFDTFDR